MNSNPCFLIESILLLLNESSIIASSSFYHILRVMGGATLDTLMEALMKMQWTKDKINETMTRIEDKLASMDNRLINLTTATTPGFIHQNCAPRPQKHVPSTQTKTNQAPQDIVLPI